MGEYFSGVPSLSYLGGFFLYPSTHLLQKKYLQISVHVSNSRSILYNLSLSLWFLTEDKIYFIHLYSPPFYTQVSFDYLFALSLSQGFPQIHQIS